MAPVHDLQGSEVSAPMMVSASAPAPVGRRRSVEVDALRARALRGDPLDDLTDSHREWVWRSLLKRVRLMQAVRQAGLSWENPGNPGNPGDPIALEAIEAAIERVRVCYEERLARRRMQRQQHCQPQQPQQPQQPRQ